MRILKKICFFVFIFFIITSNSYAYQIDPNEISGDAAILVDFNSGKILFEKNIHKRIYPASTTKILTGLLTLENLPMNKSITVPEDFEYVDGSSLYLEPGETFTVEELLEAFLVHSCNDVAVLFAQNISGDIVSFSELMNKRAKEIGCKESHFTNPHGLHDDNHYTTAYDMSLISREAMKNPEFRRIVKISFLEMRSTDQYGEKRYLQNTNRFLWSESEIIYRNEYIPIKYDIVDGIKTGYTEEAGNCLVSSAEKDSMRLIACVFKSNGFDVYRDSRMLLDYGFDNYKITHFIKPYQILGNLEVDRTVQKQLNYAIADDVSVVTTKDEDTGISWDFNPDEISLPIHKNDKIGTITVTYADGEVENFDAIAMNDLESIFTFKNFKDSFVSNKDKIFSFKTLKIIICILILILVLRIIYVQIKRRNRRNRYKGL